MTTSTPELSRILVVLKLPEYRAPELVILARFIVGRMTGNPWFAAPSPDLGVVEAAIEDLAVAQAAAMTRSKGSAQARDGKRAVLAAQLDQLRSYVQSVACANPEQATSIIESAGMHVKKRSGPPGRVFTAKSGRVLGDVDVVAPRAASRAGYEFQYSLDGGATWLGLPAPFTTKATVTVQGLTPGVRAHFRYRSTVRGVTGDWSQVVTMLVGT